MMRLEIINKSGYRYDLKDEKNNVYVLNLEFFDTDEPQLGNYINMSEELLNNNYEGYSNMYAFRKFG